MEIGPRFVLNLIKIFEGSFGGPTLYENPSFKSPNMVWFYSSDGFTWNTHFSNMATNDLHHVVHVTKLM